MSSPFIEILESPAIQPFLPFFFTLAIVYGLLSVVGKGDGGLFQKNAINLVIALVFAFFAAGYKPFVTFFFNSFGIILWSFVGLFFLVFFLKIMSIGGGEGRKERMVYDGAILLIFVSFLGLGGAYFTDIEIPLIGTKNFLLVVGLFLILYLMYSAFEMGKSGNE